MCVHKVQALDNQLACMYIHKFLSWHLYLTKMAITVPVAVTFFALIIISAPSNARSECTFSNIEVLSQFIDARINATVAAIVAELTAKLEEKITATVNATIGALNATINEKPTMAELNTIVSTTVNERISTVSTAVSALQITAAKLSNRPGKVCSVHHNNCVSVNIVFCYTCSNRECVH